MTLPVDSLTACLQNIFIPTLSFSVFTLSLPPLLFLFSKKSKRSAIENSEEHSAKYSNSNNSGNWLSIVVEPAPKGQDQGLSVVGRGALGSGSQRVVTSEENKSILSLMKDTAASWLTEGTSEVTGSAASSLRAGPHSVWDSRKHRSRRAGGERALS